MIASPASAPTATEIAAIAAIKDAPIRNLWITWSYYRLNQAMAEVTGSADLTWCGFAVWASKTAGTFIRQQEVGPLIEEWVQRSVGRASWTSMTTARILRIHHSSPAHFAAHPDRPSIRAFAAEVFGDVGGAIGAGNQAVFAHITPPFANLVALWRSRDGRLSDADRQAFLATLDNPADPQADYLRRAFAAIFDALAAQGRARAQLMLQANALIGCAEQTRVQPFIIKSMNSPVADLFHAYLRTHLSKGFHLIAWLLHRLLDDLARSLEIEFQRISTGLMMRLDLPGAALRLGENVPPLPDGQMYPSTLDTLDAPAPLDLLQQLKAIDAASSAAYDWASYDQRMRYIAILFRSRQQEPSLWGRPFSDSQIDQLAAGRMPDGSL